jgi:hypothetical protein
MSGSMRSGLTGGCSSIAGVAFGTILCLIGNPHVGQLRIPDGTKLLTISSRANVYFHEVTPLCLRSDRSSQNHYSAATK